MTEPTKDEQRLFTWAEKHLVGEENAMHKEVIANTINGKRKGGAIHGAFVWQVLLAHPRAAVSMRETGQGYLESRIYLEEEK